MRQGCPISTLLFLIVAETMAENIRCNNNVNGIKISDTCTIMLSQFADDTTLFMQNESI